MERYDQAAVDAFPNKFALRQEVCPGLLLIPLDKNASPLQGYPPTVCRWHPQGGEEFLV